jgi:hypothetical protein
MLTKAKVSTFFGILDKSKAYFYFVPDVEAHLHLHDGYDHSIQDSNAKLRPLPIRLLTSEEKFSIFPTLKNTAVCACVFVCVCSRCSDFKEIDRKPVFAFSLNYTFFQNLIKYWL